MRHRRRSRASLIERTDQPTVVTVGMITGQTGGIAAQGEVPVVRIAEEWVGGDVAINSKQIVDASDPVTPLIIEHIAARHVKITVCCTVHNLATITLGNYRVVEPWPAVSNV